MQGAFGSDSATYLAGRAVTLAQEWVSLSEGEQAPESAQRLRELQRSDTGMPFLRLLVDGVLEPESLYVAAAALPRAVPVMPAFLPWHIRGAAQAGSAVGAVLPTPFVPVMRGLVRDALSHLFLSAEDDKLADAVAAVRGNHDVNLTVTAGVVLGEQGARRHLDRVQRLIARDDVTHVSVKLADLRGLASGWAFDDEVERLVELLLPLFLAAAPDATPAPDPDPDPESDPTPDRAAAGTVITLDAGPYRDLDLTIAVFTRILDDPRTRQTPAAIMLPASVPDSFVALQELTAWARQRHASGAAPITVRLTKGAYLAHEQADAARTGHALATYDSKLATDANFLRCIEYALQPERAPAVRVAVASHNIFHLAYAYLLAGDRDLREHLEVNTQLGVAPELMAVASREIGRSLQYVPVVPPGEFAQAAGWLLAQREEDAAPDTFLSAAADLRHDGALFARERDRFTSAVQRSGDAGLLSAPKRAHDRGESDQPGQASDHAEYDDGLTQQVLGIARGDDSPELGSEVQAVNFGGQSFVDTAVFTTRESDPSAVGAAGFTNIPDTDPATATARAWLRETFADAGEAGLVTSESARVADAGRLEEIVRRVRDSALAWGRMPAVRRADLLRRASRALLSRRGELVEALVTEAGLVVDDADREVSAAIDYAGYYAATASELDRVSGAVFVPSQVTVVTCTVGAPLAAGGALAALAAGSGVIIVPAVPRVTAIFAEALWSAGISRDLCDIATIDDEELLQRLIAHPDIDQAVYSGDPAYAQSLLSWRPDLPLAAEVRGVNAVIVTASADLDHAAGAIVRAAFTRPAGLDAVQLAILVGPASRSRRFARQLTDAAASLRVCSTPQLGSQVGALAAPPTEHELWSLTELGNAERWLLKPEQVEAEPPWRGRIWRPGIRSGVQAYSRLHRESFAVPVLGLMHAVSFDQALEWATAEQGGGVTGLCSRDPRDLDRWLERAEAGTLVANQAIGRPRPQRQPAGGWRTSVIGAAVKSGGPHTLVSSGRWRPVSTAASATLHLRGLDSRITGLIEAAQPSLDYDAFEWLRRGALSDAIAWDREFKRVRDVSHLGVERNLLRYRPADVEIRGTTKAPAGAMLRVIIAGIRAGSTMTVSSPRGFAAAVRHELSDLGVTVFVETEQEWLARLETTEASFTAIVAEAPGNEAATGVGSVASRVRLVGPPAQVAHQRASFIQAVGPARAVYDNEVTTAGRVELLPFLREQAITISAERFGRRDDWSDDII